MILRRVGQVWTVMRERVPFFPRPTYPSCGIKNPPPPHTHTHDDDGPSSCQSPKHVVSRSLLMPKPPPTPHGSQATTPLLPPTSGADGGGSAGIPWRGHAACDMPGRSLTAQDGVAVGGEDRVPRRGDHAVPPGDRPSAQGSHHHDKVGCSCSLARGGGGGEGSALSGTGSLCRLGSSSRVFE